MTQALVKPSTMTLPHLFSLLAHLTPREQTHTLKYAYATAAANGRRKVLR